ncbi:MAG: hypothetical protein IJ852_04950 [Alphaproteobacteria bacterium]|nr:hypothetical protein [Alphaproteobacteria bacterium]
MSEIFCKIYQNAKGEIMMMVDSSDGGPENPRFVYDGGSRALFYRTQKKPFILRNIEEPARVPLKSVKEILIVEIDGQEVAREYMIPVRIVEDLNKLKFSEVR